MTLSPISRGLAAFLAPGLLGLAIAGCAGTAATSGGPLEYHNRDDMLDAPGVFSGSPDGLELYNSGGGWFSSGGAQ